MTEHAGLIQVTTFRPAPGRRDDVLALWHRLGTRPYRYKIACYERPRAQDTAAPEPTRSAATRAAAATSERHAA